ncbi:MAG: hypothetical protein JNK24_08165 [Alphaproteobacteria bacterium]|nr:hypothetical protein [Alphaproteobacteria bacterium]
MPTIATNPQTILESLVNIALYHGHASFKIKGEDLVKRLECCGMRIDFINKKPVRIQARNLDVNLNYLDNAAAPTAAFSYVLGNDFVLTNLYREVEYLESSNFARAA